MQHITQDNSKDNSREKDFQLSILFPGVFFRLLTVTYYMKGKITSDMQRIRFSNDSKLISVELMSRFRTEIFSSQARPSGASRDGVRSGGEEDESLTR